MAGDDTKGKELALAGVSAALGGLGGAGLALIFAARPTEAAPDTKRLEYIATLLETLNKTGVNVLDAIKSLSLGGAPIEVTVSTPWVADEPKIIFDQAIRAAQVYISDEMVDYRNAKRIVFKVESSLNQACVVQLVGNITKTFSLATNINGAFPCPANGNIEIGLAWDDWQPYIGVIITTAVAPTAGILTIWAVVQE